ncbi:MAG: AmmeMemoRadiSam system protein A [Anaerolineales bacterium]|nr:AmmeMemoRadiSam system protein A [Anaerolineales bacterium]
MNSYAEEEQHILLTLARDTLVAVAANQPSPAVDWENLPNALHSARACFVTLRHHETDDLRGCTGTLVARNPLALEVVITTRQTALNDPRFAPVQSHEVPHLHIEISVLTPMQPLDYQSPPDLLRKLRPEVDGVTLVYGEYRATFLPQVWERISKPEVFLNMLCQKMGLRSSAWRDYPMEVYTYQSIIIEEPR